VIADGLAARDCQIVAVGLSRNAQTGATLPTQFVGKPDTEEKAFVGNLALCRKAAYHEWGFTC
jgi:hypothetical protein